MLTQMGIVDTVYSSKLANTHDQNEKLISLVWIYPMNSFSICVFVQGNEIDDEISIECGEKCQKGFQPSFQFQRENSCASL